MDPNIHNGYTKTPTLEASAVEPILTFCIKGISFSDLEHEMQKAFPMPSNKLKTYLLYLIDYQIISYSGQKKVYDIEYCGLDLLDMIFQEKRTAPNEDNNDIIITLE